MLFAAGEVLRNAVRPFVTEKVMAVFGSNLGKGRLSERGDSSAPVARGFRLRPRP
jgi:hypothetical protein